MMESANQGLKPTANLTRVALIDGLRGEKESLSGFSHFDW